MLKLSGSVLQGDIERFASRALTHFGPLQADETPRDFASRIAKDAIVEFITDHGATVLAKCGNDPSTHDWSEPDEKGIKICKDCGGVDLPIRRCSKCGANGVAFVCSVPGCPVNGGAAHG